MASHAMMSGSACHAPRGAAVSTRRATSRSGVSSSDEKTISRGATPQPRVPTRPVVISTRVVTARALSSAASSGPEDPSSDAVAARATDVRVRVLRGEEEIPAIVRLCAAVFKEVAVPMPEGTESEVLQDIADFLEGRYEQAMIKDLTGVITRNQREKWRAGNQVHAAIGRIRARATSRELQVRRVASINTQL